MNNLPAPLTFTEKVGRWIGVALVAAALVLALLLVVGLLVVAFRSAWWLVTEHPVVTYTAGALVFLAILLTTPKQ